MKIIDIPQGSALWHEHRRQHFNASDAPAMMGVSPHETRNELLYRIYCQRNGIPLPDPEPSLQRLWDDGHRAERLCRPFAEKIIGEDLYPLVKSNGKLSASLDGETLMGDIDWEHKLMREELRAMLPEVGVGNAALGETLPYMHRVQMAHQQWCSGAPRTLFSASEWDAEGNPLDIRHCWYERDDALIAKVHAGWDQFERDLAAYTPAEAAPKAVAAPQEHLPAVSVQVSGALAVVSNLEPFGVALRAFVERIPKQPSTDQEFADAEAACKRLKECEDRLTAAEDSAVASMSDVNKMRTMIADLRELARTTRLASEKAVKARKDQLREQEVRRGHVELAAHYRSLSERVGSAMNFQPPDFALSIKGLKSLDSIRNAIDTTLANAKIAANELADRYDANKRAMGEAAFLFPDFAAIGGQPAETFGAILAQRIAKHEEAARAKAEAQKPAPVLAAVARTLAPPPAAPQNAEPTIRLGQLCDWLGFALTRDFIENRLGIKAAGTDRGAVLFQTSAKTRVRDALVRHLEALTRCPPTPASTPSSPCSRAPRSSAAAGSGLAGALAAATRSCKSTSRSAAPGA